MEQSADYVVAGAGSAGCVLAKRLAESGASVILLEAGGPDRTRLVRKPGMIAIFHNVPALKKRLDWGYYTAPQAAARGHVARLAAALECGGNVGPVHHSHQDHQCSVDLGQRLPIDRTDRITDLAGHDGHRRGEAAVGDRNADGGGHPEGR